MPQLVKRGKYVFAWSKVGNDGKIQIPDEAIDEYQLREYEQVIIIPGSKRSGGFSVTNIGKLKNSSLSIILNENPRLAKFQIPEGDILEFKGKNYCWVRFHEDGTIIIPETTLKRYGVKLGDSLLVVRGSNLAIGFIVKGPIIEEAKKHPEINWF